MFDSLSVVNSDTGFNQQAVFFTSSKKGVNAVISDKIKGIHIHTDVDYDANHPAGSLLDNCTTITFSSCYQYVSSGYDGDEMHQWTGIRKPLSEVIWESESMIAPRIVLTIKPIPVDFTVELIDGNGDIISRHIAVK